MKRLVIFDWDGTIADSIPDIILCKQSLALKHNLPLPRENIIKGVLGMPFQEAMAICFPTANGELKEVLQNDYHDLMKNSFFYSPLFKNVISTLMTLKSHGCFLGIATSKYREEFEIAVKYHCLQDIFDIVACGNEHPGKPDPAMLKFIINHFSVSIEDVVYIGDTKTDILFAKNAGVKAIAVTYGAHNKADLGRANPDSLVDDFSEIISWSSSYV